MKSKRETSLPPGTAQKPPLSDTGRRGLLVATRRRGDGGGRRAGVALLMLVSGLFATSARAQATGNATIAEALFRDGRALMKAGASAAACPKFEESYRIEPRVGTLLNLAGCHEKIGRTASAWSKYTEAAATARRQGQTGRAGYATERADALTKVLTRLVIRHPAGTPGLVVHLEDQDLAAATLGTALPVDPGRVTLRARAPGKQPWTTTIEAPAGPARLEVVIPRLEAAELEPAANPPTPTPTPASDPGANLEGDDDATTHPLVWIGVAVTGAAVVVGSVTGGLALSRGRSLSCPNDACAPEDEAQLNEANALATVSDVSFGTAGAGAAALVVGLVLTFSTSSSDEGDALEARIGPTWVGLGGTF
ncbi:MAG: hypothetical protein AAF928_03365 [Myxococcota bacterium]